ncbi:ligase-associated DNA damage response DEXH box helicase [Sphingomicrobium aestuariivivum]|uniref:ligase-associated DNA damage response DEXH box helicase n=1 Tax=Sphingomicrobium aestuariivivum TaxID=1582356 RepID=UPI001FD6F478|nr:ligase-associated DNA damage response DEXH box helicase [Sphingomicrobium aestuariivivum]MCJ8191451.1 ligase-associated DNA damage response DEXH box helicase [Sphingomicrobium aestuariivivum]
MSASLPAVISDWFAQRDWRLRDHQAGMLEAGRAGDHALLVAATGAGKTLAGFLPSIESLIDTPTEGLHTLYISPLKALAVDVQRNLLTPIEEMGLPIRVETRSGDTPSNRKQRQRSRPPQMLLTTPESLSLLLTYPDAERMFGNLHTIIVDEIHAFAKEKRGDLLALAMARLQRLSPKLRRVGLSATIADPDAYRAWLAPDGDIDAVRLVEGEPGAPADLSILIPEERVPWSGHSGRYAARQVLDLIDGHGASIIFCNTRSLCELIFQDLWAVNDKQLPIGVHHGSLSIEARRKVELAMAEGRLRGLVATASLDMGLDWGNVDLVAQMGAPKGSSRLLQRVGRANHRLNEPSKGMIVPGNRFEYLEARACLDAIEDGELDPEQFRPGALDVLAQHVMGVACAGPFRSEELLAEVRSAAPYAGLRDEEWERILHLNSTGGYALKAYDKYRRLVEDEPGLWRITKPVVAQKHRLNAGVIVDNVMMDVRFRNGRKIGRVEEGFGSTLTVGDAFYFSGLSLEVEGFKDADIIVRASTKNGRIVSYGGQRMSMSTHLAARVRGFLADRSQWRRFPDDVREWLDVQSKRSILPEPHELLVETFPHEGRHFMVAYSFDGWNAHQSLGMLVTNRMERAGLKPLNWVANDYALAVSSLKPVKDPKALFSADILEDEFREWVEESHLLKRAFREVAVIGGLVERQHPGQRKSGRQVSFSTDLIYDVLKRYEPDHLLMRAAWEDAKARMTELGRLARLVERAADTMVHVDAERVTPMAVPLMVVIGREQAPGGAADEALLVEAEQALIDAAMRID